MNKKFLISFGAAALLASSLMACNMQCGEKRMCASQSECSSMKHASHAKSRFVPTVMSLDLTDEQRTQIKAIVAKSHKDAPNVHDAFSETDFDKKKFIEISKEKRDGMLERKAQMMQDIYAVLNTQQKKDLKVKLDTKAKPLPKMMCDTKPKNCCPSEKKRNCDK